MHLINVLQFLNFLSHFSRTDHLLNLLFSDRQATFSLFFLRRDTAIPVLSIRKYLLSLVHLIREQLEGNQQGFLIKFIVTVSQMEALLRLLDLSYKPNNGNNFFVVKHVVNCANAGRQRVLRDV